MNHSKTTISIAGAGVMGLSAGFALSQAGRRVTLYDPVTREGASHKAGGMLAPYSEIEYIPADYIPAALAGLDSWRGMDAFRQEGTLIVAHAEDEHLFERIAGKLKGFPVSRPVKCSELEPKLNRFANGIFIKDEAHIDPAEGLQTLRDKISDIRAEKLDFKNADADWIIDCRGYESAADDHDLRGVKGESILVRNPEFSLRRPVRLLHPRYPLYIVPRANHVFMIGATVIESADAGHVGLKSALELLSAAYSLHPSFADAQILEIQVGIRPAYPDNLPRITMKDNVIRCNGLFRHGFLFAPVIARCVVDYIEGRTNPFSHLFMKETHDHQNERAEHHARRRA
ncbi:MAG: FAD-dependent oxidoreductase [Alphaproteobacteria bacterium]